MNAPYHTPSRKQLLHLILAALVLVVVIWRLCSFVSRGPEGAITATPQGPKEWSFPERIAVNNWQSLQAEGKVEKQPGRPKPVGGAKTAAPPQDTGEGYPTPEGKVTLLRLKGKVAVHDAAARPGGALQEALGVQNELLERYEIGSRPAKGVVILQLRKGAEAPDDEVTRIQAVLAGHAPGITTSPVYVKPAEGLLLVPTEEIVVRLEPGASPEAVFGAALKHAELLPGTTDQYVTRLQGGRADQTLAVVNQLTGNPGVRWAEPNFLSEVRRDLTPNDSFFPQQWHLNNTGQGGGTSDADSDVKEAWDQSTGNSNTVIAIIDDGVQTDHPDLTGNIYTNPGETGGTAGDDDGNGYDDVNGWDFMDSDNDPRPAHADDSHGTACAGVAGAAGNNTQGVAGVAFAAKILPVKVIKGPSFATSTVMANAIRYAAGLTTPNPWRGADVLSISLTLGSSTTLSTALVDANTLGRGGKGCAIFCASGNGAGRWQKRTIELTAGTHAFRWTYAKDSTTSAMPDTAWLDTVIFPDGTMEKFEGASLPSGWTTGGNANWTSVQEGSGGNHALVGWDGEGSRSIRAGTITHSQSSYVEVTKTVTSGPLTFYVWVDSEYSPYIDIYYDHLDFSINGITQFKMDHPDGGLALPTTVGYPASHANTIAVGASTDFDFRADYSQFGSALDFVSPSGGGRTGIYTTDRTGTNGYVSGDYEPDFSGTSSATPMAAGVAALMLAANPNLNAATVRSLMRSTSDQIGGVTYTSGFNTYYGYGRLNANAAVTAAAAAAATNADLLSMSLSAGALTPGFSSSVTDYTLSVSNATASTTVTPAVSQPGATITVNGTPVTSGATSGAISLAVGTTTINVLVTATNGTTTKNYQVVVTRAAPPAPEIVVEYPLGTSLTDNTGTIGFGVRLVGTGGAAKTVKIRNTGTANLTGINAAVAGANAADFSVSPPGATSLAPAEETTIDVNFTPSGAGSRSTTLSIGSDDADENPFEIALSGTGESAPANLEFKILSLGSTGSAVVDHFNLTNDDRAGIAVTPSRVFVTGDGATSSHALSDLSGGFSTGVIMDGICSDLSSLTPYTLANSGVRYASGGTTINQLIRIDPVTGTLTANVINLSATITMGTNCGIFSGFGRIVIHNGTRVYDILLPSGLVTDMGAMTRPAWFVPEANSMFGVAEYFSGQMYLAYRNSSTPAIMRARVPDGTTETISTFTSLSDLASFTVSPANGRWYFHHESGSQFGGSSETLGYADATFSFAAPSAAPTLLSPRTITAVAGQAVSYLITASAPVSSFGASGLPLGLVIDPVNGLISGSVAQAGSYTFTMSAVNSGGSASDVVTLTVNPPVPEIALADGATNLTDGVSNITFSSVNLGSSSSIKTITISNPGTGTLTGFPITVDGAHPGDFVVSGPATTSITPGSTTTFTITFTPTQSGARSATIHMGSNDGDENPFDFTVQGTAVAQPPLIVSATPSNVELTTATLNASVNPRGSATNVTFEWGLTTSYGATTSAQPAGSGVVATTVSQKLTGLTPNTTYNFRATATSVDGSVTSSNVTFTTGIAYYVNDGAITNDAWCTAIGNDSNDGLTPATPKATVQAIISTYVLEPADVVRIDTGTYSLATDITVTSTDQGSTSAPVVFEASPYGVDMTRQVPSFSTYYVWNITGSNVTLRTATSTALPGVAQRFMRIGYSGAGTGTMYGLSSNAANTVVSRVESLAKTYGIYIAQTGAVVENCLLRGGSYGLYKDSSTSSLMTVRNCTITGFSNIGVYCYYGSALDMKNCIVVADGSGDQAVSINSVSTSLVSDYNCLLARNGAFIGAYGGNWSSLAEWQAATGKDAHSLSVEPLFVDADGADNTVNNADDDLHLQSTAGSYKAGAFTADAGDSPGLDEGSPASGAGAEPSPNGGRINLGAFGGTEHASKTPAGRALRLVGPNGGESISGGTRTIFWNATGQGWAGGNTVALEYSTDGGGTWQAISGAGALDYALGQYVWNTSGLPSGGYRVRVNYGSGTLTDVSDSIFIIRSPTMIYYVNNLSVTNDIWCSATGNDANDGLTPATPKASVQAILSTYDLEPGDTVYMDTGGYDLSADINVTTSDQGGAGMPVVFEASPYGVDMTRQVPSSSNYYAWNITGANVTLRTATSTALPGVAQRFIRISYSGAGSGFMYGVYSNGANTVISRVETLAKYMGIQISQAGAVVENCLLRGGSYGLYKDSNTSSLMTVRNCTVTGFSNIGVQCYYASALDMKNCIVVADGSGDHAVYINSNNAGMASDYNCLVARNSASIGYFSTSWASLVEWQAATGKDTHSLSVEPLFVDADGADNTINNADDDLHLQSTAGSYKAGVFTADAGDSPGLDEGSPASGVGAEPSPNGSRINLGAFGGTEYASKTPAGRALRLVGPNGGESISGGTRTIFWNATGQGWAGGNTVALEYSTDGGGTWQAISGAGALDYALGQYVWNTSGLPSGGYRVRVNYGSGTLTDGSDVTFVIRSPTMIYYVNDAVAANDLWCSAPGSDANDGVTPATPKVSVQAILSAYDLEAGDVVRIDTGGYELSTDIVVGSADGGTSTASVRFEASPRGVEMVRQVPGSSTYYAWNITAPYVTLRTDPASLPPGASHRPLRLGYSGTGAGLMYGVISNGNNTVISRVETLAKYIGVGISQTGAIIENCVLRGGSYGLYKDSNTSGLMTVRNCTVTGSSTTGVYCYYGSALDMKNCIVAADGSGDHAVYIASSSASMVSNNNCLLARNGANIGYYSSASRATLSAWQTVTGKDAQSISVEPSFVDENGTDNLANNGDDDLHLTSASPCLNVGDNSAVGVGTLDMDGQARILLTTVDIGADEYVDAPEIVVELVTDTPLLDGSSTAAYGFAGIGVAPYPAKTFTIRNTGIIDLTGLAISMDGAHAAEFSPGSPGATTIPPGGNTTFAMTFVPTGISGARWATLHIASNDVDENPFDILLTGTALSQSADTDSDGMKDWGEGQLAAMGFDWQVDNSALVSTYFAAANSNGLFTTSQVQTINMGIPLLQRHPVTGVFTLTFGIEKSTNLSNFTPFPFISPQTTINGQGKIEFQFTVPDNAAFFRLQAQ